MIETTRLVVKERAQCMCPVLGNAYTRNETANEIRMVSACPPSLPPINYQTGVRDGGP